jgi:hypothetical protein
MLNALDRLNMGLPFNLNLNAVLMILVGVVFIGVGAVLASQYLYRLMGVGLFIIGIGNLLFGLTDGFSDTSPRGQVLFKLALGAYLVGVPIVGYRILIMIISG